MMIRGEKLTKKGRVGYSDLLRLGYSQSCQFTLHGEFSCYSTRLNNKKFFDCFDVKMKFACSFNQNNWRNAMEAQSFLAATGTIISDVSGYRPGAP